MDLTEVKEETFTQHLNTKFHVPLQDKKVELELVKVVSDKNDLDKIEGVDRFTIYFTGPIDSFLPQRIYTLEHEALGQLEIFIVPVARRNDRYHYEAIFNRMTG